MISSRETVFLCTGLLLAAGAIITALLLSPDILPESMLTLLRSDNRLKEPRYVAITDEVEELLSEGKTNEAATLIARGRREAKDSLDYYQYEILDAKRYYAMMKADSFNASHLRLRHFLERQNGKQSPTLTMLRANALTQRGVYEVKMVGRIDSAVPYYQRALSLWRQLPNTHGLQLMTLTNLADAYRWMGQYDKSIVQYRRAMTLGDSIGMNDATLITISIGAASAYSAMGYFDRSKLWWERAAALRPKMQPSELFQYLNNRGNDWFLQENYSESRKCFLELDSLFGSKPNMKWERMYGRVNLSDVYIKLGQKEKALPLLEETRAFFTQNQQAIPLYYLDTQCIELALLDGKTAQARQIASESGLPQWMIPEQRLLRQKVLLKLYTQLGDWARYAKTLNSYNLLQDSLKDDKVRMRLSLEMMKQDHELHQIEHQRQLERMSLSLKWAVALAVALVAVIVLLVVVIVQRQRERRLREQSMRNRITSLRMETVRNRITPHFMGNALTSEMLAQMEGREVNLNELVQLLHRGSEMTGTEQTTLDEELEFIEFYCGVEKRNIGPDFEFRQELAPDVAPNKVVLPAMFLQILVENTLKHGLKPKPRQAGRKRMVLVKATRRDEGTLVEVLDNGIGLAHEGKFTAHTGLKVVIETIQLLNEQNSRQMGFELRNCNQLTGDTGCCASLFLPDDYRYTIN